MNLRESSQLEKLQAKAPVFCGFHTRATFDSRALANARMLR